MSLEALEATQKLVLKSCGIQHAYLHLPLAAFEDSGFFCVLYAVMDKVGLFLTPACFAFEHARLPHLTVPLLQGAVYVAWSTFLECSTS